MSIALEYKKTKRTGFLPAFLCGGILAGLVPVLDMVFRSENYTHLSGSPFHILLTADWQMAAMLNVLLIMIGACILYHTEHADNGIQKMKTLPLTEYRLFWGKYCLLIGMYIIVLALEAAAFTFCILHWFDPYNGLGTDILKGFSYVLVLSLPAILSSLILASVCRNMWTSLGIGAICIFLATMLPTKNFILSLFPFALPFQILSESPAEQNRNYVIAAAIEFLILGITELILLKIRRSFE